MKNQSLMAMEAALLLLGHSSVTTAVKRQLERAIANERQEDMTLKSLCLLITEWVDCDDIVEADELMTEIVDIAQEYTVQS